MEKLSVRMYLLAPLRCGLGWCRECKDKEAYRIVVAIHRAISIREKSLHLRG